MKIVVISFFCSCEHSVKFWNDKTFNLLLSAYQNVDLALSYKNWLILWLKNALIYIDSFLCNFNDL